MPISLRLIPPLLVLTVAPWIFLGYGQTTGAIAASPWAATALLLTIVFCIYVVTRHAFVEPGGESVLTVALAEAAEQNYARPLRLDETRSGYAKIEDMRRFLADRSTELSAQLANERNNQLQAKEEEARQSRGYVGCPRCTVPAASSSR